MPGPPPLSSSSAIPLILTLLAILTGLALLLDSIPLSSATYDEVAYLKVASHWWRTGDQESITRMGSPLTFWKLQQAPALLLLDLTGRGAWIDDPILHQSRLLPVIRISGLWIWLVAISLTALWSHRLHGPWAMALSAWVFALEPNLLAHGALSTMETPIVATAVLVAFLFWTFLETSRKRWLFASALACGLAFSCKFTAIVFPPILALTWLFSRRNTGITRHFLRVTAGMTLFLALMLVSDLLLTAFATQTPSEARDHHPALESRIPPSLRPAILQLSETPLPADLVAFAIQVRHQRSGGPSFLMGERRMRGWSYYYLVAMSLKVPLAFWLLFFGRFLLGPKLARTRHEALILIFLASYLTLASVGSTRNYGLRYLLPIAPLAVVWISGLASGSLRSRTLAIVGLLGMTASLATIHPHDLTYFNILCGGRDGGRRILSDSNLDWGQGARSLARLQADHPEFRNLTLFYFGDTDPRFYGVSGTTLVINAGQDHPGLPPHLAAHTKYLAVSSSLLWGPWGPPGYFHPLRSVPPLTWTDDGTIAIFRSRQTRTLVPQAQKWRAGGVSPLSEK